MRLTVLGSSGTYAVPDLPASGYVVTAGDTEVLLDLGFGVFPALRRRASVPSAIVLSHEHPDHCVDLFALFNALRFELPEPPGIPVMCPQSLLDKISGFLEADRAHDLHRVFSFDPVSPGDERTVGSFLLRFGASVHPVPALITRLEAAGRSMVYSGDTGPGSDLDVLATGVDLLLCEASMLGVPAEGRYPHHLFAVEAGEAAARAEVGRLIVTHVPPNLDPTVAVDEAAAAYPGPIEHAVPGMEIEW
ncbi:MAG TPA: MBL fold metallo-hydrolase [Acidimicrobiia bacterium]|nr:MBL fold metallo-hydrolase [Acidimicrobiia bacterium]